MITSITDLGMKVLSYHTETFCGSSIQPKAQLKHQLKYWDVNRRIKEIDPPYCTVLCSKE